MYSVSEVKALGGLDIQMGMHDDRASRIKISAGLHGGKPCGSTNYESRQELKNIIVASRLSIEVWECKLMSGYYCMPCNSVSEYREYCTSL
jgi:hypothetical protein